MRVTTVSARSESAVRSNAPGRWRETALLLAVSAILAAGLWQAREARQMLPGALLLRPGTPAAEIAARLPHYRDAKQRTLVASQIAAAVRHRVPDNVGYLAAIHLNKTEAARAGVLPLYQARFDPAHSDRIRLFPSDEFAAYVKPSFIVRTADDFRGAFLRWWVLLFAAFWATHLLWVAIRFQGDRTLLPVVFLLSGVSVILMVSLRDPLRDLLVFVDIAAGIVGGCALLALVTCADHFMRLRSQGVLKPPPAVARALDRANDAARWIAQHGEVAFALSLALSAALLIFGSGPGESGVKVRLWFFQPVEVVRLLLVLFLASYFARRWEFLRELEEKRVRLGVSLPRLDHALPVVVGVVLAIVFFFLQQDLGPALVLSVLFLCLYGVARRRIGLALVAAALLLAVGSLAYKIGYPHVVVTRVAMWLEPWDNGMPRGEQVVQSLWALASGGVRGMGLAAGHPESIPAGYTDLILSVAGEEFGFMGILALAIAYVWLFWRGLRIALDAPTVYQFFLALGLTLALALEAALIAGGILGVLPLAGVVTPFLSYGASATLANFLAVAILAAISARPPRAEPYAPFRVPVGALAAGLALFTCVLLAKAAWVGVVKADATVAAGTLVYREDGSYAIAYNPRLLVIARLIPRGAIYDRNGLPLATSHWEDLEKHRAEYAALGVNIDEACSREDRRLYPFGPVMFNLIGDIRTRARWTASNAAFEERVSRTVLEGFDDRETVDTVELPRSGQKVRVVHYDFQDLVPLLRARMNPANPAVIKMLAGGADVRMTVDTRLQLELTHAFSAYLQSNGWHSGAVAVIGPETGDLLAAVSLPLPGAEADGAPEPIDFARFGQYPPGSSFKIVTAIAALRKDPGLAKKVYQCVRLPDGRVGNTVRGRTIRDDILDREAHGSLDMTGAIVHSCNAYFAQLGAYDVGAKDLLATAALFNIETAKPNTAERLNDRLPQASYGQGEVTVTPLRMARVAGAVATGGKLVALRTRLAPPPVASEPPAVLLPPELAKELEQAMRGVVTSGTGREAAKGAVEISGKTGTAELAQGPAHAWFMGFAPSNRPAADRIAFAILIEHGRYGGRAAAPFAVPLVDAASHVRLAEEKTQ